MYKPKFSKRVFPPKGYIIQGILKPEERPKENKQKIKNHKVYAQQKSEITICSTCDFQDKQSGHCLIKRLRCSCPYTSGSTGYVAFKTLPH